MALNTNLNNNITLSNNANITIGAQGVVDFNQSANSDTKGGIALAAGSTSAITNNGTMNRAAQDGGNKVLQIPPPVTANANSTLFLDKNCSINFAGKYTMNAGTFKKGAGSSIGGFTSNGGAMTFLDPGAAGSFSSYFLDDLKMANTTVAFEQITPNAFTSVQIAGLLQMTGGDLNVPAGDGVSANTTIETDGGNTIELAGNLASGGTTTLNGSTVTISGGQITDAALAVNGGAVLTGYGALIGGVTNAGEVDAGMNQPNVLSLTGNYTQTGGVTNIGTGGGLIASGAFNEQGGQVNLNGGNLEAAGGLQIQQGAILSGVGDLTAEVTNAGNIVVGGTNATGALTIASDSSQGIGGDYTETDTGSLDMEIANGSRLDQLFIDGVASLGGALNVTLLGGFTPPPHEVFDLLTYASRSGVFATINLPSYGGGYFVAQYDNPPDTFSLLAMPSYGGP